MVPGVLSFSFFLWYLTFVVSTGYLDVISLLQSTFKNRSANEFSVLHFTFDIRFLSKGSGKPMMFDRRSIAISFESQNSRVDSGLD